jgi:hypothetical protein
MGGKLGKFDSHINLFQNGKEFTGAFRYKDTDVSDRKIQLLGGLVANVLTLQEVSDGSLEVPGVFIGRFDGQSYIGNWEDAKGKSSVPFRFELTIPEGETNSIADHLNEITKQTNVPLITYELYGEGLFPSTTNGKIRATIDGRTHEDLTGAKEEPYASSEYYFDAGYKLAQVLDLNGNGYQEALIEDYSGSGTSNCHKEFFVCYFDPTKEKFEISNSFGSSCPTPEIVNKDGKKLIKLIVSEQGFDKVEMIEHTEYYQFNGSEKVKLVETIKTEPISAVKELLASHFNEENGTEEITLEFDLDKNGQIDKIVAGYWFRWGVLDWRVYMNGNGKPILSSNGKRIGVLSTTTHGVHDLINDLNIVYFWNGEEYVSREQ